MKKTLIYNPEKIYIPESIESIKRGNQDDVQVIQDSSILLNGKSIESVASTKAVSGRLSEYKVIDAEGKIITPGFVDSHTHLVYGGGRSEEFILRSKGAKYIDLIKSGNGILKTVRDTRETELGQIVSQSEKRLVNHMKNGVTTVEIKTGYGLDLQNEKKLLDAMDIMQNDLKANIIKTLLPLHAVPPELNREEYVKESIGSILPHLYKRADFVDSFCDEGVFTPEDTSKFFSRAMELGMKIRLHADEIKDIGALKLVDSFPLKSVDHLLHTPMESMDRIAGRDVVATILPGTAFSLGEKFVDSRKWMERHIPVAVASDISPLNPITDIKFHGNLAIRNCSMSPEALLNGITSVPAHSLGLGKIKGNIKSGMGADLLIVSANEIRDIFYDWANVEMAIIKEGKVLGMKEIKGKSIKH